MNVTERPPDDLTIRIDQISRARRRLAQSVAASGIAMRRDLDADRLGQKIAQESWPHPVQLPSRVYPRARAVLLTLAIVLTAVIVWQRRVALSSPHIEVAAAAAAAAGPRADAVAAQSPASSPVVVPVEETLPGEPAVVRVRATRQSRIRTIVDGTTFDWRTLQQGDEILARPRQQMIVESDDGGALSATVDGRPFSTGRDGEQVMLRLK